MQPCRVSKLTPPPFLLLLLLQLRPAMVSSAWAPISRTITVDRQRRGDFWTVQSAVDSVPDGNREWIRIYVKEGDYWEKVTIPQHKRFILLEGETYWTTKISFNAHAHPSVEDIMSRGGGDGGTVSATFSSATFTVLADDFVARNISFKNSYSTAASQGPPPVQAVAALVAGDRAAFHDCGFYGYQDTLCDYLGRQYFHGCYLRLRAVHLRRLHRPLQHPRRRRRRWRRAGRVGDGARAAERVQPRRAGVHRLRGAGVGEAVPRPRVERRARSTTPS
ncbi:hypothetical protein ACP4OV_028371 [Aristida adscensionis]